MAACQPDLYEDLENLVMCPLCLDRCTDPKCLPCVHTFCRGCLDQHNAKSGHSGTFLCPTCRNDIQVPKGGAASFPAAFFWSTLGDTVDKFKELRLHTKPCCTFCQEDRKQSDAETLCTDCMKTLCVDCLKYHKKMAASHNVMSCTNIQAKDLNTILGTKSETCPKHPEKTIELYCETCSELVCMICAAVDHSTHMKQELTTVEAVHRDNLQTQHNSMAQRVKLYDKCIRKVIQVQKNCQTETDNKVKIVEKHGEDLMQTLQLFIQQLTTEITTEANKSMANLKALQKTLEAEQLRLKECVDLTGKFLEHANAPTVIKASISETPTYRKMLSDLRPSHPLPVVTFDLDLIDIKKLTQEKLVGNFKQRKRSELLAQSATVSVPLGLPGKITPRIVRQFTVPLRLICISTTSDDNIVMCRGFGSQVFMYSLDGHELVQFQTPEGTGAWGVYCTDNNILVADGNKTSILVFNMDGTYSRSIPLRSAGCLAVCVQDDRLYVTTGSLFENKVYQLHWPSGSSQQVFAQHTSEVPLKGPMFVAANSTHVAVSCRDSQLVQVFDTSGKLHYTYTGQGSLRGLGSPQGVAMDSEGTLFVSARKNHCIHIVSRQGRFIGFIGLGENYLYGSPWDVAINSKGEVVVAINNGDNSSGSVVDCGNYHSVVTYTFNDTDKQPAPCTRLVAKCCWSN